MTTHVVQRFEIRPMDDPNRVLVSADLVAEAAPPSAGRITATAEVQIWVGDNPTFEQLQLRVLHAVAQTFALQPELRARLGDVYSTDPQQESSQSA